MSVYHIFSLHCNNWNILGDANRKCNIFAHFLFNTFIHTIVVTFVSGALIQKFLYIIKERKEKRDGYVTRE